MLGTKGTWEVKLDFVKHHHEEHKMNNNMCCLGLMQSSVDCDEDDCCLLKWVETHHLQTHTIFVSVQS